MGILIYQPRIKMMLITIPTTKEKTANAIETDSHRDPIEVEPS